MRGLTSTRYRVQVELATGTDWVEAVYIGEEKQQGLVNSILEGERTKGVGRYRRPGIAELEYWSQKGWFWPPHFTSGKPTLKRLKGLGS